GVSHILAFVAIAVVGGCVSTHNLRESSNPLGGGFFDTEVKKGFYRIVAKSNFAMWADTTGARMTWSQRAEQLCGPAGYQELEVRESADQLPGSYMGIPERIAIKVGYAL